MPTANTTVSDRSVAQTPHIRLDTGAMVGDYRVEGRIAPESGLNNIYVVHDTKNNRNCALKLEVKGMQPSNLEMELWILLTMKKKTDCSHFCKVYTRGTWNNYEFMVLTLCGKSLRNLLKHSPGKKFSLGCAIGVARQALKSIMHLHKVGFIHRDVQPSNFAIGRGENHELRTVYMLDFYYIHKFRHRDGELRKPRDKPTKFKGSLRYASKAAHEGTELSRADDVESWLYVLMEMVNGQLPWDGLNVWTSESIFKKQKKLREKKEQEAAFHALPKELPKLLEIVEGVTYYSEPPYGELLDLLDDALHSANVKEFPYDWEKAEWAAKLA